MTVTNKESGTNINEVADREAITLAETEPTTLACMHGNVWKGDGGALLRELKDSLGGSG
jgi:hypothetical protein